MGFFCLGGPETPTECDDGNYCPGAPDFDQGVSASIPCPPGYFLIKSSQSQTSLSSCSLCPAGFYCPAEGTTEPVSCTDGGYCIPGLVQPLSCPPGTLGNGTELKTVSECEQCPAGQYCSGYGQTSSNGECDPGFYCSGGATQKTPGCLGHGLG